MKKIILCFVVLFALLIRILLKIPSQDMHVYFLDIGQGDATFIRTPLNQKIIVDGGPNVSILSKLSDLMMPFEHDIDLIVLTHPHEDHLNGLIEILTRYQVGAVLITGINYQSSNYRYFLELIKSKRIKTYLADSDQDFDFGKGVFLDVIYPPDPSLGKSMANVNNDSIVLRLTYGENQILLSGDAEREEEHEILTQPYWLAADILKAGHHGSRTSSSDEYLVAVDPQAVIISAGVNNSYQHPHEETLLKLYNKDVYRTDLSGGIEASFDSEKLRYIRVQNGSH